MTWIPTSKDKKFGVGKIKISLKMFFFCYVKKRLRSLDVIKAAQKQNLVIN